MFRTKVSALSIAMLAALGCETQQKQRVAQQPPAPQPARVVTEGRLTSSYAYPTGHNDTSVLLIERDLPAEIVSGQEFSYDMTITNIGHKDLNGVTLRDDCAAQLTLISANPMPVAEKPPFLWTIGDMKAGEVRTVHVVGKTSGAQPFTSCASASYNSSVCLTAPIVEPALRITLNAPAEATPCDTIPIRLTVTNTGTGTAHDVRLAYPLPEGWTTADGKTTAMFNVPDLAAKESREFTLNVKPQKTGDFSSRATASGAFGLKAEAPPMLTAVRQAVLAVKAEGPQDVYPGRPVLLKFTVSNNGTAPATQTFVETPIPQGVKFVSASEGGNFRNGVVTWNLQTLPIKASKSLTMTLQAETAGTFDAATIAKAYCADTARDVVKFSAVGIPALLLEVTDLVDPIEIGSETAYEIVITNQGTAPATNVKILATLEGTQAYLQSTGSKARVEGQAVTFDAIPTIAPKATVTLKVNVKCLSDGDTRFTVSMTADQLTRPVQETESTHIYR